MEEPSIDAGEVDTRLYLIGPADQPVDTVLAGLPAVLDVVEPAAFLLRAAGAARDPAATALRDLCRERGAAFFVEDDLELAETLRADGAHLTDPGAVPRARDALTKDRIVGAEADRSRHAAMLAGEEGADYIAFGRSDQPVDQEILDLVAWWSELFLLPCLAFAETPDEAKQLALAGADFVGVSQAIWNDPEGPAAAALRMQAAIDAI